MKINSLLQLKKNIFHCHDIQFSGKEKQKLHRLICFKFAEKYTLGNSIPPVVKKIKKIKIQLRLENLLPNRRCVFNQSKYNDNILRS